MDATPELTVKVKSRCHSPLSHGIVHSPLIYYNVRYIDIITWTPRAELQAIMTN